MDKSIPAVFIMVFIILFAIFAYNGYQFPKFLVGETETVKGVVDSTNLTYYGPEPTLYQVIRYSYEVDGNVYKDMERVTKTRVRQQKGDTLVVEYETSDPKEHTIIKYAKRGKRIKKPNQVKLKARSK